MRHFSKTLILLLIVSLVLGSSASAFAQPKQQVTVSASEEDEEAFADYVAKGSKAFGKKDYKGAANYFEKAFEVKAVGVLLKNALVAWYKAGDCEEASRVAARLVAFVGSEDLSRQAGSEVSTVVDCALDKVDDYIAADQIDQARSLLTLAAASEPNQEQRTRIDDDWKKILEITNGVAEPIILQPALPVSSFYAYAPWLAGGLLGLGTALEITGVILINRKPEFYYPGISLASFGALSLVGGAILMILWAKPSIDHSQPAFSLYENESYQSGRGIKNISLIPDLSYQKATAAVRITF